MVVWNQCDSVIGVATGDERTENIHQILSPCPAVCHFTLRLYSLLADWTTTLCWTTPTVSIALLTLFLQDGNVAWLFSLTILYKRYKDGKGGKCCSEVQEPIPLLSGEGDIKGIINECHCHVMTLLSGLLRMSQACTETITGDHCRRINLNLQGWDLAENFWAFF